MGGCLLRPPVVSRPPAASRGAALLSPRFPSGGMAEGGGVRCEPGAGPRAIAVISSVSGARCVGHESSRHPRGRGLGDKVSRAPRVPVPECPEPALTQSRRARAVELNRIKAWGASFPPSRSAADGTTVVQSCEGSGPPRSMVGPCPFRYLFRSCRLLAVLDAAHDRHLGIEEWLEVD